MTTGLATHRPPSPEGAMPDDSARRQVVIGIVIAIVFFLGLGGWAALAPLNAAVIGIGTVKVEGSRKSVQHLDGGNVDRILVKDGDHVAEGDILLVLDGAQLKSEQEIYSRQLAVLRATEARLTSELQGESTIAFPAGLLSRRDDPEVKIALASQEAEFSNRRAALEGQEETVRQRIAQLAAQIRGFEAQIASYRAQLASIVEEKESLADLLAKQLIPRSRILQLERTADGLDGQVASAEASIAQSRQAIAEQQNVLNQIRKDRLAEISRDVRDVQAKILDVEPRLQNAQARLYRLEVRAPYSGTVVGLKVVSVGAVINRGEKILDIVPDQQPFSVDAQFRVEDIADIRPGMDAEVHFTSYKQRTVPSLPGRVTVVSADRLVEDRTGAPYYLVSISVDAAELERIPEIQLYPGMPASVIITTKARNALDYLLGPLAVTLDGAFRQK